MQRAGNNNLRFVDRLFTFAFDSRSNRIRIAFERSFGRKAIERSFKTKDFVIDIFYYKILVQTQRLNFWLVRGTKVDGKTQNIFFGKLNFCFIYVYADGTT